MSAAVKDSEETPTQSLFHKRWVKNVSRGRVSL